MTKIQITALILALFLYRKIGLVISAVLVYINNEDI